MEKLMFDRSRNDDNGFTLIELVLTLAIAAVLIGILIPVLTYPAKHIEAQTRRAELNKQAALIAHWLNYDVKRALPNSIRVSADGQRLELIATVEKARYRALPGTNPPGLINNIHALPDDFLDPVFFDSSFNITGRFDGDFANYGTPFPSGYQLAIYADDIDDVYNSAVNGGDEGPITDSTNTIDLVDDGDEDQINLTRPHRFAFLPVDSEKQRLYVIETAVLYRCSGDRLERYVNYQPENPIADPPTTTDIAELSNLLNQCNFNYVSRSPPDCDDPTIIIKPPICSLPLGQREIFDWGVATIQAELKDGEEKLTLSKQVHVDNSP